MDVDHILGDRLMWKDGDNRIMNILDNIEVKENKQFPVTCPICGKKEGHLYFHRYENEIAGGMWVWCSACKHSAHSRFREPHWWKNLEEIDFQKLASHPVYLEEHKNAIDDWVNKLLKFNKMTFSKKVLQFNDKFLSRTIDLPTGYKVINPFIGDQKKQVKKVTTAFYQKYYNDTNIRRLILGSSPSRRGSAVTGVPFEDAKHLQKETGIFIDDFYVNRSSSGFLYDDMREYGGCEKFYTDFYMNFVCPLGIVRTNSKGNEVNCNYYENKKLQNSLYSFIIDAIRIQIGFGIDTSVCYCIGSGENYSFLSKINDKFTFFNTIIPLEHPRYIMQYNSKDKDIFVEKYIRALSNEGKYNT